MRYCQKVGDNHFLRETSIDIVERNFPSKAGDFSEIELAQYIELEGRCVHIEFRRPLDLVTVSGNVEVSPSRDSLSGSTSRSPLKKK